MLLEKRLRIKVILIFYCVFLLPYSGQAQPEVYLSSRIDPITNDSPITIYVDFSEDLSGLESTDFEITNGSIVGEVAKYSGGFKFGQYGLGDGEFASIIELETDGNGNIYVLDNSQKKIQVFDKEGNFIKSFGEAGDNPGQFNSPAEMVLDGTGNIYIGSSDGRVEKYDNDGNYLLTIGNGNYGEEEGDFKYVNGIELDSDENIYVLDGQNYRVQVFDADGNFLRAFGESSEGIGGFFKVPTLMSMDADENLYVGFPGVNELTIYLYDKMGNYINKRMLSNYTYGPFHASVSEIFVDGKGQIFTTNYLNIFDVFYNSIHKFNEQGELVKSYDLDQEQYQPYSLTVDHLERIIVSSSKYDFVEVIETEYYSYKAYLQPENEGVVTIQLPENTVENPEGVRNGESNVLEFNYEETNPTVTISTSTPSTTSEFPFVFDVQFSEPVKSFTEEDFSIEGFLKIEITGGDDTYQAKIWPKGNDNYNIKIPGLQVHDLAGNFNEASNTVNINFETTVPEVVLETTEVSPTDSDEIIVKVDFTEPITGLDKSDFSIRYASVKDFCCVSTDTIESMELVLEPLYDRLVEVYLVSDGVHSLAGNNVGESNHIELIYDVESPNFYIRNDLGDKYLRTNASPINLYVYFNEEVDGLEINDFQVSGANITSLEPYTKVLYPGTVAYHLILEPEEDGKIEVSLLDGAVTDQIGNTNETSDVYELEYSTSRPSVQLSTDYDFYKDPQGTIYFFIRFDKDIDEESLNFDLDFEVEGGSMGYITSSGKDYTAKVRPLNNSYSGEIKVKLLASKVEDLFGNNNLESNELSIKFDRSPMTISMTSETEKFDKPKFTLEVKFSEEVSGLEFEDFTAFNCKINSWSESDKAYPWEKVYHLEVESFVDEGWVEIGLDKGAAYYNDILETPEAYFEVFIDSSPPEVYISSSLSSIISGEHIPIIIQVDDPVFDFQVDPISCLVFDDLCFTERDITVIGADITNFKGSFGNYTCDLVPSSNHVEISIDANVAYNIMDLGNLPSNVLEFKNYGENTVLNVANEKLQPLSTWVDTKKTLHIKLSENFHQGIVSIMDYSGRKIESHLFYSDHSTFNMEQYQPGVYLVNIQYSSHTYRSKILISK